jgi:hypothetical protein
MCYLYFLQQLFFGISRSNHLEHCIVQDEYSIEQSICLSIVAYSTLDPSADRHIPDREHALNLHPYRAYEY